MPSHLRHEENMAVVDNLVQEQCSTKSLSFRTIAHTTILAWKRDVMLMIWLKESTMQDQMLRIVSD